MKILAVLSMILFTSPLLAQGTNSCPNRGLDPNTFCVPGMIWSEELKTCVTMA